MKLNHVLTAIALSFLPLFGCSDDGDVNGTANVADWNATIDGQSGTLSMSSQEATTRPDGGIRMSMAGTTSHAESVVLTVTISGGVTVDLEPQGDPNTPPSATLQIGAGDINFTMDVGSDRYRGTSGTIIFTAYDPNEGGDVNATFDAGLVTTSLASPKAATLTGEFKAVVVTPTPTPTPTPGP
ncbi:MAG TPA: hypothetical protein VI895_03230 [Bdellovibrionota bacterium]|nr:hypothetical protein [Bdellovibrionota bacterium]